MNHLLDKLNAPQRAAVTLPAEHALILAGAGSGKTRVLTTRIAWLLASGQVGPAGILAVTFTNKAAKEMQARLAAMLPINLRGMWIGTFHGLCNRFLRTHHREAGLPPLFQILDAADQLSAVKRLLKAMNVDDEKFPPRELCHFINTQKEQGLRAAAVEAWDGWARRRVELYAAYETQCQREGVVDFAELLLRCYEVLERNEPLRRHYQERFRYILVDEFQDTNKLQYKWLKLLVGWSESSSAAGPSQGRTARGGAAARDRAATESPVTIERSEQKLSPPPREGLGEGGCLFCVGDDDQSIYAFRGADVGNMRDFEREFKVTHLIRLEQNYRSHGNILDAANAIICNNPQRLGKNLWTEAGSGEPIRVFEAYSENDEARWIVEEVKALCREGHARSQIALLYRSNAQSRALEHALFNAGITYRVYGGLRFFERTEIKHALAYLRLIANPHDDTAFARVVNFPTRGIGARSLEALQNAARAQGGSLFATIPAVSGKGGAALASFATLLERLREASLLPLPELVEHVLEHSGLSAHYRNDKEGLDRLANLDELINAAVSFVAEAGVVGEEGELAADLANFLAHAALEAGEHQAGEGDDALQLMTVHSAKGLEFDVVFISGLEEGLFPHENSVTEDKGLEEERRLMYVAVTRARQRLYLSSAQSRMLHGQTRYNLPSRFIQEIPPALLKWLTPRVDSGDFFAVSPTPTFLPSRAAREDGPWRIGQSVRHAKFGSGVIVGAEGRGSDVRVEVNFAAAGTKWLALSVAKLEAA